MFLAGERGRRLFRRSGAGPLAGVRVLGGVGRGLGGPVDGLRGLCGVSFALGRLNGLTGPVSRL